MDLSKTKIKDLPESMQKKIDCSNSLQLELEGFKLISKAFEITVEKLQAYSRPPKRAINIATEELELYQRLLQNTEESLKLVANKEQTYVEYLLAVEKLTREKKEIFEEIVESNSKCLSSLKFFNANLRMNPHLPEGAFE